MDDQLPHEPARGTDWFPQASTGPDDPPPSMFDTTWTCHVCSDERPDERISVHRQPVITELGQDLVQRNIRYCNDRPTCVQGALDMEPLDLRGRGA